MRRRVAMAVTLGALLVPSHAAAGGWATSTLSSTPDGTAAGQTWVVDVEVLQHGETPATGLRPAIELAGPAGATHRFAARPTGEAGIYRARVTFPRAGRWEYVLDTGFGERLTFPPVAIEAPATRAAAAGPEPDSGARPWWVLAAALAAGLAAASTTWWLAGLRRTTRGASRAASA